MILLRPTVKRDLSLFSVKAWESGYVYYLKRFLKWPYPIIFYFDGTKVKFYHTMDDFNYFKRKITAKLVASDHLFNKLNNDFAANISKLVKLKNRFTVSDFRTVADLVGKIMSFYIFIVSDAFIKLRPEACRSRKISEGILYQADRLIEDSLKKLLKNKKIDADLAHFLTIKEVETLVAGAKLNIGNISMRKAQYIIYNQRLITGVDFIEFCQKHHFVNPDEDSPLNRRIAGKAVFPYGYDKVRGKAVIVNSRKDLAKITKSSILVAAMTNANYINAIRKSRAIITDEGGILCHAAIIARELRKPCVINTKNATSILKDGDLVEVDADKGIVKIIK